MSVDHHQRNAYGTTRWTTDYAGRNPVDGMIKDDGSFEKDSCRVFGLAAHTLAALMAAVVHNLEQTGRTRNRNKRNKHPSPRRPNNFRHHRSFTNPMPGQPTPARAPT